MNSNMEISLKSKLEQESELGISLLEMLIVMMITSILSYLSITTYQQYTHQRQLIHSVRETIAFLSYQRQQALLFNIKIKISLHLSPSNKVVAMPFPLRYSTEKQTIFRLASGIQLKQSTVSNFTFGGIRQTLRPMSFVLQHSESEVKIVISSLGRIRACSQQIKVFSPC
ncbi:potassium:proton antiporter [Proteus faecis]|uniref:Potassium:proton antiporter n=2 Tax=Proteus faecis TaxID=2050967 RepID=A0ABZ3EMI8_9GAMM|nr:potassium:proton antiporter [Proteus faecis]MDO5404771.1 potassium:proton antiporter [Proteus sp. (in: enterobacteria)]